MKFCRKAQFTHSFGRFAQYYAETVSFHRISTPRNKVKLRYFSQRWTPPVARKSVPWKEVSLILRLDFYLATEKIISSLHWFSSFNNLKGHKKLIKRTSIMKKKWSFLLSISSVNMTKSAFSCRFGHIYERNL